MKFGIVSDVHSNLHALKAVLEHMDYIGVDKKVSLGDNIGYGPKPVETLELVLQEFNYLVMGNHDYGCIDEESTWGFNPSAKKAIDWTRAKLSEEHLEIIKNIQMAQKVNDILFIHGSPYNYFDYILSESDASKAFGSPISDFKVAFVGHTHSSFVWYQNGFDRPNFSNKLGQSNNYGKIGEYDVAIPEEGKAIINVGSVGQTRDGDNRATYAVYDTYLQVVTIYKVPYAIEATVGLMQREGFEDKSWQRLIYGR